MNQKPKRRDMLFWTIFLFFITFQPYLFQHEIIMMETGIHLPGINAFLHGALPYRDFFIYAGHWNFMSLPF